MINFFSIWTHVFRSQIVFRTTANTLISRTLIARQMKPIPLGTGEDTRIHEKDSLIDLYITHYLLQDKSLTFHPDITVSRLCAGGLFDEWTI